MVVAIAVSFLPDGYPQPARPKQGPDASRIPRGRVWRRSDGPPRREPPSRPDRVPLTASKRSHPSQIRLSRKPVYKARFRRPGTLGRMGRHRRGALCAHTLAAKRSPALPRQRSAWRNGTGPTPPSPRSGYPRYPLPPTGSGLGKGGMPCPGRADRSLCPSSRLTGEGAIGSERMTHSICRLDELGDGSCV
jgi:hypothetical protein